MIDENTSRQVEELYRSDDWAELRWAREHSTHSRSHGICSTRNGGTATTTRWTNSWK